MTITEADERALLDTLKRSQLAGLTEAEAEAVRAAFDTIEDQLLFLARTGKPVRLRTLAGWTSLVEMCWTTVIEESGFLGTGLLCTFVDHDPAEVFPDRPFAVKVSHVLAWSPTMTARDAWDVTSERWISVLVEVRMTNARAWNRLCEVACAVRRDLPLSLDDRVALSAMAARAGFEITTDLDLRVLVWLAGASDVATGFPVADDHVEDLPI